jgi:ribosomal-protein-alanine N-acetyltransferase
MIVLETSRLRLRPFAETDASAHAALYADPEVTRFLPGGPFAADAVQARSARSLARFYEHWSCHGWGVWAVVDKRSDRLIGQCGLNHLPDGSDVELLYALVRSHWGHGLAAEAGAAALEHGFTSVGLDRIVAVTRPDHTASRRVMERLGMAYEGERDAFGMHLVCYALDRAAWRRLRAEATS